MGKSTINHYFQKLCEYTRRHHELPLTGAHNRPQQRGMFLAAVFLWILHCCKWSVPFGFAWKTLHTNKDKKDSQTAQLIHHDNHLQQTNDRWELIFRSISIYVYNISILSIVYIHLKQYHQYYLFSHIVVAPPVVPDHSTPLGATSSKLPGCRGPHGAPGITRPPCAPSMAAPAGLPSKCLRWLKDGEGSIFHVFCYILCILQAGMHMYVCNMWVDSLLLSCSFWV